VANVEVAVEAMEEIAAGEALRAAGEASPAAEGRPFVKIAPAIKLHSAGTAQNQLNT